jgi:AhpD family alkylhydroperoxidase
MLREIIPLVREDELSPEFAAYVEKVKQRRVWVPNNTYALANAPELGMAARHIFDAVTSVGSLPRELRYLIRYVVSNLNACRYCMAHQTNRLKGEFGISQQKLTESVGCEDSSLFTNREKAALNYAKALTLNAGGIPDTIYDELIRHFNPQERVEITVIAAAMNAINIVNDGLRLPLEEEALATLEEVEEAEEIG